MARSPSRSTSTGARLGAALLLAAAWPGLQAAENPERVATGLVPLPPAEPPATRPERRLTQVRREPALLARLPPLPVPEPRPDPAASPAAPSAADLPEPAAGPPVILADLLPVAPDAPVAAAGPAPAAEPAIVWPSAGGPPQPVVGPRRDPVEPPLLDAEATTRWVLAVRLNGQEVSQGSVFLELPPDGRLYGNVAQLRLWRVILDDSRIFAFEGEGYYPLDAIPGARWTVDRTQLAMTLEIPPEQLLPFTLGAEEEDRPEATTGTGAFLDYELQWTAGSGIDNRLDSLIGIGTFTGLGVLASSLQGSDLARSPSVTRLDTTFTRDLPERRASLRLGDSLTAGGAFARPLRFGGVQWATNFATDPGFVTFPMPAIGGLADQQSVVEVFIDNLRQATGEVPAGPFQVDNIPAVTGAGEVQLVVRDLLGRERIVTQPYYVSARLLREGLHDFSYEAGAQRRNYGSRSFDYGDILGSATHRYGLSDTLTLEGHADAAEDAQSVAGGGSLRIGNLGVLSGGLGASLSGDGPGAMGTLAWEYQSRRFSAGLRGRYASRDFGQAGNAPVRDRGVAQLNLGYDFGSFGRLGLLALAQDQRGDGDIQSVAGTYGLALGPGTLLVRAAQIWGDGEDFVIAATYTLPLGETRSASVAVERNGGGNAARAQFRQGRGASDLGLDYRIGAGLGDDAQEIDAQASYQTTKGTAELDVERFEGDNNLRASLSGSAGLVDGAFGLSRRLGQAFGMVAAPGFPNVRVYVDNREAGRTDNAGYLLLPDLRPYQRNRVRLEVEDLPLDAQIGDAETDAVPFATSGLTVDFDLRRVRRATARLVDGEGRPLPPGLELAGAGDASAWIARDGFTQVLGTAAPVEVSGEAAGRRWTCPLPAVPESDLLPDLGTIACR
ncbi:MAG: fimbria/pilus outer membrane usher protein [Geminicoccaceae bacterium]